MNKKKDIKQKTRRTGVTYKRKITRAGITCKRKII